MPLQNKPTLADVAQYAKVSTATVSRALNAPETVAQDTRDAIQAAIETLGYTPHFAGRALASNRSNTIGVIIPTLANAMFANGIHAFQEELSKAGVIMLLATSDYDPEQEYEQVKSLITHGADGLMLIGANRPQKTRDFLRLRGVPYVLSWCFGDDPNQTYAGFDNAAAAAAMTRKILSLGHRKIALIGGISKGNDRARGRIEGVKSAIAAFGMNAKLVAETESPYLLDDAQAAFDRVHSAAPDATAIIGGSDVLAAGAILRANALGLRVPEDLSITGFDDIGLAAVSSPPLTTVHVPQVEMGRAAACLLLQFVQDRNAPQSIEIETQISMRGSLTPPPQQGKEHE